jgi:hypothetical protein
MTLKQAQAQVNQTGHHQPGDHADGHYHEAQPQPQEDQPQVKGSHFTLCFGIGAGVKVSGGGQPAQNGED